VASFEFAGTFRVAAHDRDAAHALFERFAEEMSAHPDVSVFPGSPLITEAVEDGQVGFSAAAFPILPDESSGDAIGCVRQPSLALCMASLTEEIARWLPPQKCVDHGEVPCRVEIVLEWHNGAELGGGPARIGHTREGG